MTALLDHAQAIATLTGAGYTLEQAMRWWLVAAGHDHGAEMFIFSTSDEPAEMNTPPAEPEQPVDKSPTVSNRTAQVDAPSRLTFPAEIPKTAEPEAAPCADPRAGGSCPSRTEIEPAHESALTPSQAAGWRALAAFAREGEASPSLAEIARRAGVPKNNIQNILAALRRKGFLRNDGERGAPRYTLLRRPDGIEPAAVASPAPIVAPEPDPVAVEPEPVDEPDEPDDPVDAEPPPEPPLVPRHPPALSPDLSRLSASERAVLTAIAALLGGKPRNLWTEDIARKAELPENSAWQHILALARMGAIRCDDGNRVSATYTLLVEPERQGEAA